MDQVYHEVIRFNRFTLDLTRGCLREGDRDIGLRPKPFEVLRYLATSAGRLISKQELLEAVWPGVSVSDDSLVQCIRELREKLGDADHRLIKTVPRRGYLLDAALATLPLSSEELAASNDLPKPASKLGPLEAISPKFPARGAWGLGAVASLGGVAVAIFYLLAGSPGVRTTAHPSAAANVSVSLQQRPAFRDCDSCPEMVELPPGVFAMGSPPDEVGYKSTEGPQRHIRVPHRFALGKFEVTIDQFSAFVAETGVEVASSCFVGEKFDDANDMWKKAKASFRQPGFEITGSHPVTCVNWYDAHAYTVWLTRRTGKPYRLPTEAEWEYAARAGTTTAYNFGSDETRLCTYARFADFSSVFGWRSVCRSGISTFGTLQVGTLEPNAWGLFDMYGNAWEWVADCWTSDLRLVPADGSAFTGASTCETSITRGGGFSSGPTSLRSAHRRSLPVGNRAYTLGFRVAVSLERP